MTELDENKDVLRLYSTHERHSFQENEAFANLEGFGELVIEGLIWGLQQDDIDLKLTAWGQKTRTSILAGEFRGCVINCVPILSRD